MLASSFADAAALAGARRAARVGARALCGDEGAADVELREVGVHVLGERARDRRRRVDDDVLGACATGCRRAAYSCNPPGELLSSAEVRLVRSPLFCMWGSFAIPSRLVVSALRLVDFQYS